MPIKTLLLSGCLLLLSPLAQAQTARPLTAAPDTTATTTTATSLVTNTVADRTPATDALKVRVDTNPVTRHLTVRTNTSSPVRVEINDDQGHPIMTRDMIVGDQAAVLDVSRLPVGYYLISCTAGDRRGTRRVLLGQ